VDSLLEEIKKRRWIGFSQARSGQVRSGQLVQVSFTVQVWLNAHTDYEKQAAEKKNAIK